LAEALKRIHLIGGRLETEPVEDEGYKFGYLHFFSEIYSLIISFFLNFALVTVGDGCWVLGVGGQQDKPLSPNTHHPTPNILQS
jgi:hypothetical protein